MSPPLPSEIPIFPLTGALLLPTGKLPLNVFEPRYRAMVEDALKGDRIVGMIQPREVEAEARAADPPVYSIGCAGRMTLFHETKDRRYEIVLDGISRFEIDHELPGRRGYRMVQVRWDRFDGDLLPSQPFDSKLRDQLIAALERFLGNRGSSPKNTGIAELSGAELVGAIAMACPFHPIEKQALLEAVGPEEQAKLLAGLLEMALLGGETSVISRQ